MAFAEIRFPDDISYGSRGGPCYLTRIVATDGGFESRNSQWSQARARYNVAHGVKTEEQLAALIAFFRARKGRAYGFRFKDWSDFAAVDQSLGSGDGATTTFALSKTYTSGDVSEVRPIAKPVAGTVRVYVGGELVSAGVSVDLASGRLTFATPPGNDAPVSADFEFDVPVRFDTDALSASLDAYGVQSWLDIPLVELRL